MSTLYRIQLLGDFNVQIGDIRITSFGTQKAAMLLAFLACFPDKKHSRESLIEMLWPECDSNSGRQRLSTTLWTLRRIFEPSDSSVDSVVISDRTSVSLSPSQVTTDVKEFEALLECADKASSTQERRALLQEALSLYHGALLPEFYVDLIIAEQTRLEARFIQKAQQFCILLEEAGDFERAIHYAQRIVNIDALQEEGRQLLIRLLVRAGHPLDALRQYHDFERKLQAEWGISPSDSLQHYVQKIKANTSTKPLTIPVIPLITPNEEQIEEKQDTLAESSGGDHTPSPTPRRSRFRLRHIANIAAGFAVLSCLSVPYIKQNTPASIPPHVEQLGNRTKIESQMRIPAAPPNSLQIEQQASPATPITTLLLPRVLAPFSPTKNETKPIVIPAPKTPKSEGKMLWAQRYVPHQDEKDSEPTAVTTDKLGNTYLCGFVHTTQNDVDFLVMKYAPEGDLLWRQRWNSPRNDCDRARSIAVDSKGNVYVTGEVFNGDREQNGTDWDVAIVKYNAQGKREWEHLYNGAKWDNDRVTRLCIDSTDKVYVVVVSRFVGKATRYTLLKYDASGHPIWTQFYDAPIEGHSDVDIDVKDVVIGKGNHLYLVGEVVYTKKTADNYVFLACYDYHGNPLWMRRYSGEKKGGDRARKLCLDREGNIYIAGMGYYGRVLGISDPTGREQEVPIEDTFVVKYSHEGREIWTAIYDGDFLLHIPDGLAVDSQGGVLLSVTRGVHGSVLVKISSKGELLWKQNYLEGIDAMYGRLEGVAIDAEDSIYVVGNGGNGGVPLSDKAQGHVVTTKFSSEGKQLWQRIYSGGDHGNAPPCFIRIDGLGNVFATGRSKGSASYDIMMVKYTP
jgi:DNA-binding SARP family transcriptional activator